MHDLVGVAANTLEASTVKVFISSVTYMLKEERNALPPFLRLFEHEPLRFEDFRSQDRSSREACLAGVQAADVYVLLLGPRYGDPFPDSGLAPTAEEFQLARNRGIPILVFEKHSNERPERAQQAFKADVGHYVNGKFWKSFTDPLSLNQAVGEALKHLPEIGGQLRLRALDGPLVVPWISGAPRLRPREVTAPVLELHLLPVGGTTLTGANGLTAIAKSLARDVRSAGFISDPEPLDADSNNDRAWSVRPAQTIRHRTTGLVSRTEEAWRGVTITATGAASAFVCLTTDLFGAVIDQASLQRQMAAMIRMLAPHMGDTGEVSIAAQLSPADQVQEGNPA